MASLVQPQAVRQPGRIPGGVGAAIQARGVERLAVVAEHQRVVGRFPSTHPVIEQQIAEHWHPTGTREKL